MVILGHHQALGKGSSHSDLAAQASWLTSRA
jgi:hypothetical protein